jgi:hypothetical protein
MTCQVLLYGSQHVLGAEFSFHGLYTFIDFTSFEVVPTEVLNWSFDVFPSHLTSCNLFSSDTVVK